MKYTKFKTDTGLKCGYRFNEDGLVILKLFTKVEKRFYYSAENEMGFYFDEVIKPTL